ncbi:uncharacterized protein LOC134823157 [Bolinopsis microptera]|uniref:uncharacterized protein LOC134823157 n=1 Tax=Bolinopsis microptera TaxID=2820187 RepID=UPI00307A8A3A
MSYFKELVSENEFIAEFRSDRGGSWKIMLHSNVLERSRSAGERYVVVKGWASSTDQTVREAVDDLNAAKTSPFQMYQVAIGSSVSVSPCHVEGPEEFYVQLLDSQQPIEEVLCDLYYYRRRIALRVSDVNTASNPHLDSGLTKKFMQQPMYAIRCKLDGIDPNLMEQMSEIITDLSIAFNVLLDKSVEVGSLKIGEQDLDTEDVRDYALGSGRSQLQFINLAQLIVTGRTVCTNHQGCLCGNQLDCSSECPRRDCVKPIKSKGMCCHYCGAEVRFRPPAGFYLEKFKKSLGNFLKDDQLASDQISITVSLQEYELSTLSIQITVSDSIADGIEGAGYESSKIASKIRNYIVDYDIVRASELFIVQSHLQFHPDRTEAIGSPQAPSAGIQSWVLYVVLSVSFVLLIIIVVLLFKCSRRYRENTNNQPHVRLDHGVLPRALDRRFKPCVPAMDQDIPTYEEVLMEDMLTRGIAPDQPRNQDNVLRAAPRRPGYAEIPTTDICDRARV